MNGVGAGSLIVAAGMSGFAALMHLGIIFGGPDWYRFFGAGEGMAQLASNGSWLPAFITFVIASVLSVWSAYALSAAGVLPTFPFLRTVLVAITAVYLLRGIAGFVLAYAAPGGSSPAFWIWSSIICLLIGVVHAIGLTKQWPILSASA